MASADSLTRRLGGRLLGLLPSMRRTRRQVVDYATAWSTANSAATGHDGPLWIVLGDSAAQGVGASAYDKGWVGLVRDRLPDPAAWRLVNLSRSGARTRDVLETQLPEMHRLGLRPDLLVVAVGGNDLTHTDLEPWLADLRELLAALPAGTVVATTPRGWREPKARAGNELIRAEAAARGLVVADLWEHTGPPYRGRYADGFHPNDRGYRQWADAIAPAVLQQLAGDSG